eukprot:scaffold4486_cov71-Cylindrotheca_fusiformis.AAC.2
MDAACKALLWLQPAEAGEGVTKCVLSTEDEGRTTLCKRKLMRLIGPLPVGNPMRWSNVEKRTSLQNGDDGFVSVDVLQWEVHGDDSARATQLRSITAFDCCMDEVDSMSFPNDSARRDSEGSSTSCWLILDFPKIQVGHNQVDFMVSKILETTLRETLREVPRYPNVPTDHFTLQKTRSPAM